MEHDSHPRYSLPSVKLRKEISQPAELLAMAILELQKILHPSKSP